MRSTRLSLPRALHYLARKSRSLMIVSLPSRSSCLQVAVAADRQIVIGKDALALSRSLWSHANASLCAASISLWNFVLSTRVGTERGKRRPQSHTADETSENAFSLSRPLFDFPRCSKSRKFSTASSSSSSSSPSSPPFLLVQSSSGNAPRTAHTHLSY